MGHIDTEHVEGRNGSAVAESDAEGMSPDPADDYADIPVDVMDSEVREAELTIEDSAYVRSYLQASDSTLSSDSALLGDRPWPTSWPGGAAMKRRA